MIFNPLCQIFSENKLDELFNELFNYIQTLDDKDLIEKLYSLIIKEPLMNKYMDNVNLYLQEKTDEVHYQL